MRAMSNQPADARVTSGGSSRGRTVAVGEDFPRQRYGARVAESDIDEMKARTDGATPADAWNAESFGAPQGHSTLIVSGTASADEP